MFITEETAQQFRRNLYSFEAQRAHYKLAKTNSGFFQPFQNITEVQTTFKTILMSPVIGFFTLLPATLSLIRSIITMAIAVLCLSPDLLSTSTADAAGFVLMILGASTEALVVTVGSAVSLVTRTMATIMGCSSDNRFDYEFLSFLPNNPVHELNLEPTPSASM